jgi:Peptidase family M23
VTCFNTARTLVLVGLLFAAASCATTQQAGTPAGPPSPLEISVPFEPTAFPSAGRTHLLYELYLKNTGATPLPLSRIEVLDARAAGGNPMAAFEAETLDPLVRLPNTYQATGLRIRQLAPGASAVVFMEVAVGRKAHVPDQLLNRVISGSAVQPLVIGTHHTELREFGPPVRGANWIAADGPSNDEDNHHRRGIITIGGRPAISRRYAIDWLQVEKGTNRRSETSSYSGDARDKRSYYAYGKDVFAVADGLVVTAKDGFPENVPGHNAAFHPAMPGEATGNAITLDLGGGQFASYFHLQPGSLRVKVGDRVRRGQVLARIGDSGDAREPHLHFEITTDARFAAGEGVPYVIDQYRILAGSDVTGPRKGELPLNNMIVDFGHDRSN